MRRPSTSSKRDNTNLTVSEAMTTSSPVSDNPSKKKKINDVNATEEEEEAYQQNVIALIAEYKKEMPNKKTLRKLMEDTFASRRQWIQNESPKVEEIFASFPPLSQSFKNVSFGCLAFSYYCSVLLYRYGRSLKLLYLVNFLKKNLLGKYGRISSPK